LFFFSNFCLFLTSNLFCSPTHSSYQKKKPQQVSAKRHYSKDARKAMEAVCEEQIAEMKAADEKRKDNVYCCCFKQCFYETKA
jgi:hypothetical protein